jgi:hypothetical protein
MNGVQLSVLQVEQDGNAPQGVHQNVVSIKEAWMVVRWKLNALESRPSMRALQMGHQFKVVG